MVSGLYKYIVFDPIERSTGKVYDAPCHRILGHGVNLPNSDWVAENHWCAPLYYHGPELPEAARAELAGLGAEGGETAIRGIKAQPSIQADRRRAGESVIVSQDQILILTLDE